MYDFPKLFLRLNGFMGNQMVGLAQLRSFFCAFQSPVLCPPREAGRLELLVLSQISWIWISDPTRVLSPLELTPNPPHLSWLVARLPGCCAGCCELWAVWVCVCVSEISSRLSRHSSLSRVTTVNIRTVKTFPCKVLYKKNKKESIYMPASP